MVIFNSLKATFDRPPSYEELFGADTAVLRFEDAALRLLLYYLKSLTQRIIPGHAAGRLMLLADTDDAIDAKEANSVVLSIKAPRGDLVVYLLAFINFIDGRLNNMDDLEKLFCPVFLSTRQEPEKALRIFRFLVGNSFYYLSRKSTVEGHRLRQPRRGKIR